MNTNRYSEVSTEDLITMVNALYDIAQGEGKIDYIVHCLIIMELNRRGHYTF
jgi:hypothetical protein